MTPPMRGEHAGGKVVDLRLFKYARLALKGFGLCLLSTLSEQVLADKWFVLFPFRITSVRV